LLKFGIYNKTTWSRNQYAVSSTTTVPSIQSLWSGVFVYRANIPTHMYTSWRSHRNIGAAVLRRRRRKQEGRLALITEPRVSVAGTTFNGHSRSLEVTRFDTVQYGTLNIHRIHRSHQCFVTDCM